MFALGSAALDRRLDPALEQPIAVAVSGGGDSLAALIVTKAWADRCGRPVIALYVDHGLQASSGAWGGFVATAARRLGAGFRALAWTGEKPERGLAAAARQARHALIAEAARAAGATAIVLGHTADDIGEAAVMRAEGSSLGVLSEWRPSPVWPRGRGVFLLRPLLAVRRAAIRQDLRAEGWDWIDDPANDDLRQPRVRARRSVAAAPAVPQPCANEREAAALARAASIDEWATIRIDRDSLRRASGSAGRRVLAAAMLSAGGGDRPPRRERVDALLARLAGADAFAATLAGAKALAGREVVIVRDAGESARGGLVRVPLEPGRASVWDGRFELRADRCGLDVVPLKGAQSRLDSAGRRRIKTAAAAARPAAPLVEDAGGRVVCPILAGADGIAVRSLVGDRFLAACGAVCREPRA